jgi:peptide/nickel transport system substrate-binding protein
MLRKISRDAEGRRARMQCRGWLALGLLAALATGSGTVAHAADQPLRAALEFEPAPLDPATDGSYTNRIVTTVMCDSLIDLSPDLKFIPELATSWDWAPDHLSLTLHLREGVSYQDGTPLDAASIAANINRYKTASYSIRKAEMSAISGTEVVDAHTIRVLLSRPYAPLLTTLANRPGTPYSPKLLDKSTDEIAAHPVCAGPFRFVDRVAEDHITLERWPGYWNAAAIKLPGIVFRTVTDSTIRKTDLEAGALDISDHIAPTDVAAVNGNPKLRIAKMPSLGFVPIEFNVANGKAADTPLGRDARVRRAFSLAIDRNALNQVAFDGQYIPSNQMEVPGSTYYDPDHPVPARDIPAARKLMQEAGVDRVAFTMNISTDPLDGQVAEIIQSMVKDAGFDMKIVAKDAAAQVADTRSGNFQASMLIWSGRADPDGNTSIWLTCSGFTNWGKYCNPTFDALMQKATEVSDPAQRIPLYRKATDIWLADSPDIVIYHFSLLWGLSRKVGGFQGRPDGLWRPEGMTLGQ